MFQNKFHLFTMLLLFIVAGGMKAQETLTVYDGTGTYTVLPMDINEYNYSTKSQYVIPASDLTDMTGGIISSITYYTENGIDYTTDTDVKVYLKEVSYTTFSTAAFETVTNENLVYNGKINVEKSGDKGIVVITLDTPYKYSGGNLLISTENNEKQKDGKQIQFLGLSNQAQGVGVSGTDIVTMGTIAANLKDFLPKTTFTYAVTPEITKVETAQTSATISWKGKNEKYLLRYREVEFFDDFESGLDKWTVKIYGDNDVNSNWYQKYGCFNDNVAPHSGSYTAVSRSYADKALTVDNWLISPRVLLGGTLKFWVRDNGKWHEYYEVLVSTTTQHVSAFECVAQPGNASAEWTEITIDLSKYAGKLGYFAIRNKDTDQNYIQFDDVVLYQEKMTWTEVKDATSPYVMDQLDGDVTYLVQVKGVNSNDVETDWSAVAHFGIKVNSVPDNVTASSITAHSADLSWKGNGDNYEVRYRASTPNIILYEGFENGLGDWTRQDCHASSTYYYNTPAAVHTGEKGFGFHYTTKPPQYLISPEISATAAGTQLLFYYRCLSSNYPESFKVGYSSTTNEISAFTFGEEITTSSTDWLIFNENVPAGTKYICIKCTSDDQDHLFIDDITVYEKDAWQTVSGITETSTTITGLQAYTNYEFQVRSVKASKIGDRISEWTTSQTFKTLYALELADDDSSSSKKNADLLGEYNGAEVDVTLADRTLYKDGDWNTLCLPFNVTLKGSPLEGATVKKLDSKGSYLKDGKLTLTFEDEKEELVAGTPYIIKWEPAKEDLKDPVFTGVTITSTTPTEVKSNDNQVSFVGQYSSFNIVESGASGDNEGNINEIILLSNGSKLGYSKKARTLHALRCHFKTYSLTKARSFEIDFGDGVTTGIQEVNGVNEVIGVNDNSWYTIDGRKLDKRPSKKGVYVHNGEKMIVK